MKEDAKYKDKPIVTFLQKYRKKDKEKINPMLMHYSV